ncbi:MAG: uracil phosphoribosyltransferase [Methylacidiphilales bacterium]|nr:uracil phosphoribosyltransferase [Candidatus Methylacidiphilales bacterium]MDW8349674.1 uracil phosphoribosyltransferase [Verrucomicrobiae bacterium]
MFRWQACPQIRIIEHPLLQTKLTILRDRETPTTVFRETLRQMGALMLFVVSRDFETESCAVHTPIEATQGMRLRRPVVLVPILRAGLGLIDGMLDLLPGALVGHIGMSRNEETLVPHRYYGKVPKAIDEAEVLILDPMLATGNSAVAAIDEVKRMGAKRIRFVCLLSSPEGLERLHRVHADVPIFTVAVDRMLNDQGFIMPGLGDAGDRYFGT